MSCRIMWGELWGSSIIHKVMAVEMVSPASATLKRLRLVHLLCRCHAVHAQSSTRPRIATHLPQPLD